LFDLDPLLKIFFRAPVMGPKFMFSGVWLGHESTSSAGSASGWVASVICWVWLGWVDEYRPTDNCGRQTRNGNLIIRMTQRKSLSFNFCLLRLFGRSIWRGKNITTAFLKFGKKIRLLLNFYERKERILEHWWRHLVLCTSANTLFIPLYLVYDLPHSSWFRPVIAGSFNLSNDHYNNTGTKLA